MASKHDLVPEHKPGQSESTVSNRVMELVVAGLFMAVAAVVMRDSLRVGAGWAFDGPEAGYFPFYVGLIMFIASAVTFATHILTKAPDLKNFVDRSSLWQVLKVLVPTAVFVVHHALRRPLCRGRALHRLLHVVARQVPARQSHPGRPRHTDRSCSGCSRSPSSSRCRRDRWKRRSAIERAARTTRRTRRTASASGSDRAGLTDERHGIDLFAPARLRRPRRPGQSSSTCASASSLGVLIGVLPGLGGANGVAILLPLTFTMSPTAAIIMLSSIYWGALFGGAITSILFNIPGEPWSVATTFDGHPMAQQGRADQALTAAFTSSFVGAFIAVLVLTFLAPVVAGFALTLRAGRVLRGAAADVLQLRRHGAGIALQGARLDDARLRARRRRHGQRHGQLAHDLRHVELLRGFDFLIAVIGLFGVGEILLTMEEGLAFRGKSAAHQSARRARNLGAAAALLGHLSAQRRRRLLARHHARAARRRPPS